MYKCRTEELYGIVGVFISRYAKNHHKNNRKEKKLESLFLSHPTGNHSMFLERIQLVLKSYRRYCRDVILTTSAEPFVL